MINPSIPYIHLMNVRALLTFAYDIFNHDPYLPTKGETFCNRVIDDFARNFGFYGFSGLLANNIVTLMQNSTSWEKTTPTVAQSWANVGRLTVAGQRGKPHGHTVVILPGMSVKSGKWRTSVPRCLDIGAKHTFGRGVNYAFVKMPEFYKFLGPR